jgi:D-glycero-alpha-D-manno-heptose-7-phosphate kinase
MIITRTPYRVSFFGGGTDYPQWYNQNPGAVLTTTIDKYCFISCRTLPQFFEHKFRIVYSVIESINNLKEIQHPSVRETLIWKQISEGLEIHHDGDLPARSGLGSSSSFTVGLINALEAHSGKLTSKKELATDAIYVEQDLIKENVGSQDQIATAYGGLNKIQFFNDHFEVNPIIIAKERQHSLNNHLMLFFTGTTRIASEIAKHHISNINKKNNELVLMYQMVNEAVNILQQEDKPLNDFGYLLHESWKLKKSLSDKVSNSHIDSIYETAKKAGALGGKVLGAGGGGFMIFFVPTDKQNNVKEHLKDLVHVPFKFEHQGSSVVLYEPNGL